MLSIFENCRSCQIYKLLNYLVEIVLIYNFILLFQISYIQQIILFVLMKPWIFNYLYCSMHNLMSLINGKCSVIVFVWLQKVWRDLFKNQDLPMFSKCLLYLPAKLRFNYSLITVATSCYLSSIYWQSVSIKKDLWQSYCWIFENKFICNKIISLIVIKLFGPYSSHITVLYNLGLIVRDNVRW